MLNSVSLTGRLVRDHESRTIGANSTLVLKNAIAVDRAGARDEEGKYMTGFFDIEVWDKQAEILEKYAKKGSMVGVTGNLKQDTWEKDGQKNSKVVIRVSQVVLLDKKEDSGGTDSAPVATAAAAEENPFA